MSARPARVGVCEIELMKEPGSGGGDTATRQGSKRKEKEEQTFSSRGFLSNDGPAYRSFD